MPVEAHVGAAADAGSIPAASIRCSFYNVLCQALTDDREEAPCIWDALEGMVASILKLET